ncbi:protein adenylyltransferase SelO [Anaerosinus massiliensis]|uniref:protein adenylyltransferase SelO n=1 Tax=Massilibacillus massiliensis TaxID=1806837 RepID=UPI000A4A3FB8|nr:YdiU family protein [Massilibacillus massiliensis]
MTIQPNANKTGWNFDHSYTHLPELFFSPLAPTPVKAPKLIMLNQVLAKSLGLNPELLKEKNNLAILSGNAIVEESTPLAQAYAGHQFGHFTMLGDGRAVLLGEQITPESKRFDIQLKGAGKTPYSRGGDGRAALGPMLREYIISEAMHALGIPTTRSLAVALTGESIYRETAQPGAILTRIAASHIRVGTFQYAANFGSPKDLQALADYTLKRHFPTCKNVDTPYIALLEEVIKKQASLIAQWQLVGFIHGVMNTDNMTISGETIDYGPCAFMDTYDPATVFSSIDRYGRYAYTNQPQIALWNLTRFAETLLPLLHETKSKAIQIAEDTLSAFTDLYHTAWLTGMRNKLGMLNETAQDETIIQDLLNLMQRNHADYTNTFRDLTFDKIENTKISTDQAFHTWHEHWQARLCKQSASKATIQEVMRKSNPAVIPRNHQVELALEAAVEKEDYAVMDKLLEILAVPYAHSANQDQYAAPPSPSDTPYQTFCGT